MNADAKQSNKSVDELIALVSSLEQKLEQRDAFIKILQQELALAKHRYYGRKSEKNDDDATQPDLFDEPQLPDNKDEVEQVDEAITVSYKRKKPGRKPLPKALPRTTIIHDLNANEKQCACGCLLTKIDEEKTEQLNIIPAKVEIIEHVRIKYACKSCKQSVKTAKLSSPHPIPKSIASPGLLAYVATAKYCDHLPLYRQEAIFKRLGIDIARNTLASWMIKASNLLLPIYRCLTQRICDYNIAFADETRVQVLKEPERDPKSQSYMWCFVGGPPDERSIIYHYDKSRANTVIAELIPDFSGYLHCDGYVGYDAYASAHEVKLVACWAHCRRKFVEITKVIKSEGLAHKMVKLIAKLYKVEAEIQSKNLSIDEITLYRQQYAKPILEQIRKFIDTNAHKVLPKSAIGRAFAYANNQWLKLIRYIDDGRLHIDNSITERAIKPFVIGRKNYLFCDSVKGAHASQVLYSLIETCKAHGIEPCSYLCKVFELIPAATTLEEIEKLLPFTIEL